MVYGANFDGRDDPTSQSSGGYSYIYNYMKLKINPKSVNIIALQSVINTCIFKATSSA
jgi:hypothetical protein